MGPRCFARACGHSRVCRNLRSFVGSYSSVGTKTVSTLHDVLRNVDFRFSCSGAFLILGLGWISYLGLGHLGKSSGTEFVYIIRQL